MSKAKSKQKPNTAAKQAPTTFPPFKPYTKNDLQFDVFTPKDNFFYLFIAEKIEPNDFILSQNSSSFLIQGPSDIQRFRYYPETKNIYTFFGFETNEKRTKAMKNKTLLNSAVDGVATKYPLLIEKPAKHSKSKNKSKDQTNRLENIDYSKFPEFNKYEKDDLKFHKFDPQSNLFYIFFAEKQEPTQKILKLQFSKLYGISYSLDIRRFCYYPGTKNIYTFMGFANDSIAQKAAKTLHKVALNWLIFNYPYQPPEPEENKEADTKPKTFFVPRVPLERLPKYKAYTKNDLVFKNFIPKRDSYYIFFSEQLEPTKQILNSSYTTLYGIDNANDIQRFCYYPHTKNLYTFIGFENSNIRNNSLNKIKIKDFLVDGIISSFPIHRRPVQKTNKRYKKQLKYQQKKSNSNTNKKADEKEKSLVKDDSNSNQQPSVNPNSSSEKQSLNQFAYLIDSSSEEELIETSPTEQTVDGDAEHFFEEETGIYYLCFMEKNCDVKNVRLQNANLFGINNIKVVQRGFRFPDNIDSNYYTFLGFEKTKERTEALVVLQKLTDLIAIETLNEIDEFEYDYDDDDDDNDNDEADIENDVEYEEVDDNRNDNDEDDDDDDEDDDFD